FVLVCLAVCLLFLSLLRPPPISTLFPYTTLFRSYRFNIKASTTNDDRNFSSGLYIANIFFRQSLKVCSRKRFTNIFNINHIMGYSLFFMFCNLTRTDIHTAIDLHGIPLIISAGMVWAILILSSVLPTAVGPTITITLSNRFVSYFLIFKQRCRFSNNFC